MCFPSFSAPNYFMISPLTQGLFKTCCLISTYWDCLRFVSVVDVQFNFKWSEIILHILSNILNFLRILFYGSASALSWRMSHMCLKIMFILVTLVEVLIDVGNIISVYYVITDFFLVFLWMSISPWNLYYYYY